MSEREKRKNNAIFYNVPEPKTNIKVDKINEDMNTLKELAKNIDINLENENITKLTRIDKRLEGEEKHRPLLVTFSNDDIKRKIFKNFARLRSEDDVTGDNKSGIKNISINHDMTPKEREELKVLIAEAKEKEEKSQGKFIYRVRGPRGQDTSRKSKYKSKRQYSTCK